MSDITLHDAIFTQRAMRRLLPDPVSDEDIRYVIEAAPRAPSAANGQQWAFIAVRDAALRKEIGALYLEIAARLVKPASEGGASLDEASRKVYGHAWRFAERIGDAPVHIIACMRHGVAGDDDASRESSYYGSIFPAVQNLMLAARSRGLGTVLTTLHLAEEPRFKKILAIPDKVQTVALIPLGYPDAGWKQPLRDDVDEVIHWDGWRG